MDKATSRLRVLALLVVVMFLALSTRLWFLQVLATQGFNKEAHAQSIRTAYTDPTRGQILALGGRGHSTCTCRTKRVSGADHFERARHAERGGLHGSPASLGFP
jgi:hypothetical protein